MAGNVMRSLVKRRGPEVNDIVSPLYVLSDDRTPGASPLVIPRILGAFGRSRKLIPDANADRLL